MLPGGSVGRRARGEPLPDPVAPLKTQESANMILVGMSENNRLDSPIPKRQSPTELTKEHLRIPSTVNEDLIRPLRNKNRVTLPDIQEPYPDRRRIAIGPDDCAHTKDHYRQYPHQPIPVSLKHSRTSYTIQYFLSIPCDKKSKTAGIFSQRPSCG